MATDLQHIIIRDILSAAMPDGSSIRPAIKADIILSQIGAEHIDELRRVIITGITRHAQKQRRHAQRSQDA